MLFLKVLVLCSVHALLLTCAISVGVGAVHADAECAFDVCYIFL